MVVLGWGQVFGDRMPYVSSIEGGQLPDLLAHESMKAGFLPALILIGPNIFGFIVLALMPRAVRVGSTIVLKERIPDSVYGACLDKHLTFTRHASRNKTVLSIALICNSIPQNAPPIFRQGDQLASRYRSDAVDYCSFDYALWCSPHFASLVSVSQSTSPSRRCASI